ncbi:MAG TPA: methionine synthase [Clostridium sp.]|nr:methionine synthase [Clostridium sp.]
MQKINYKVVIYIILFDLKIDRDEVLRYLGHNGQVINDDMMNLIDECRKEVVHIISPRFTYGYKNVKECKEGIEVEGTNLILKGNDIKNHLKNSTECALMAVTLGNEIERRTRQYEKTNLTKGLILDACATTAIEELCDMVENEIKEYAQKKNMSITFRYSPGYGDFPLDIQKSFLNVLDAQKKIGLTVSENYLLFPRKSVTAVIGIINKNIKIKKKSCEECNNYENCSFRRKGENCGA